MAREQTEDLPTRGLRPANVAGGQYRVAVQQAPESGYTKLARSLSNVSAGLQAYAQAGETVSEMYEQELQGMTLEQVKAEQSKMQKRLDGAERKGILSFFGNPLNWERNEKALGRRYAQLLHDDTVSSKGRFYNPQTGDDRLPVGDILEAERSRWLTDNTELMQNPIMLQAFEGEWQQRSRMLEQRFNDQKRREFLENNTRSSTTSIVSAFIGAEDSLDENGNIVLDDTQLELITQAWSDMNGLSVNDQLKVIHASAKMLAYESPALAYKFLDYMEGQTVGGANYSTYSDYIIAARTTIQRIEKQDQDDGVDEHVEQKKKSRALADVSIADYTTGVSVLTSGRPFEWGGKTYENTTDFRNDFRVFAENGAGKGDRLATKMILDDMESVRDLGTISADRAFIERNGDSEKIITGRLAVLHGYLKDLNQDDKLDQIAASNLIDDYNSDLLELQTNISHALATNDPSSDLFGDDVDRDKIYAQDSFKKANTFERVFSEQAKILLDDYRLKGRELRDATDKIIEDRSTQEIEPKKEELRPVKIGNKKGIDRVGAMEANLKAIIYGDESVASKASSILWENYDTEEIRNIANGTTKYKVQIEDPEQQGAFDLSIEYTDDERAAFEKFYLKVKALDGAFTDLHLMKETQTKGVYMDTEQLGGSKTRTNYEVDASKLNISMHRILTREEVERGDPNEESVKIKASRLGENGIPPAQLIDEQKLLYKKMKPFFDRIDNR
jgi:hypothetical protein